MDSKTAFEFLIAGGGTAGCVLASRLSLAGFSVAMFETGPEDYSEQVMAPLAAPTLHGSSLEYNFLSKEQQHLSNRRIPNFGGRMLSGSSAVNYANWTRCHSADYNAWGKHRPFPLLTTSSITFLLAAFQQQIHVNLLKSKVDLRNN